MRRVGVSDRQSTRRRIENVIKTQSIPDYLVSGQGKYLVHFDAPSPVGLGSFVKVVGLLGLSIIKLSWPAFVRFSMSFGTSNHPPVNRFPLICPWKTLVKVFPLSG